MAQSFEYALRPCRRPDPYKIQDDCLFQSTLVFLLANFKWAEQKLIIVPLFSNFRESYFRKTRKSRNSPTYWWRWAIMQANHKRRIYSHNSEYAQRCSGIKFRWESAKGPIFWTWTFMFVWYAFTIWESFKAITTAVNDIPSFVKRGLKVKPLLTGCPDSARCVQPN